jgi:putative transposase
VSPLPLEGPLRKSRFTEEQIILALKQHEAGRTAVEICRKLGVSEQTFYRWKAKFGGMDVADAKRLRGLEEENRKLKQLVGELSLDNQGLRYLLTKKF